MPLSPPAERNLLHLRDIELRGYARADGQFDIEARLTDTKTYAFANTDRGEVTPGVPLHGMFARMTVDAAFLITQFEAVTEFGPFAICPDAAPGFASLAGLTVGRGFLRAANERVGGTKGCVHLRELLGQMGTVAFQTIQRQARAAAAADPARRPPLLDTCMAFADGGTVARRTWPEYYGAAPAAEA